MKHLHQALSVAIAVAMVMACGTEGDTCDHPFQVDSSSYEKQVDLGAMQPDLSFRDELGPCVSGRQTGDDAVFAVELSSGQSVVATMTCSFYGASIYALFDCESSLSPSQCIDGASSEYAGDAVSISFSADTNGTAFVVVDHEGAPLIGGGDHVCDVTVDVL